METLKNLSLQIVYDCIFQWPLDESDADRMNTTMELIAYFEKLPFDIRDEILTNLNWSGFWHDAGGTRVPMARYVALFLHKDLKQLRMEFYHDDFDLEFLLQVSGDMLKNLTEFRPPESTSVITTSVCEEIWHRMPNLQRLDFTECIVEDDGMIYVAKLPLVSLDPGLNITDDGIRHLCADEATIRKTLRIFKLRDAEVSLDSHCLILRKMRLMEDLHCSYCTWFNPFSPINLKHKCNIRKLRFVFSVDGPEDVMDIDVDMCPKVVNIQIISNIFTPKMLHTLTRFKGLSSLYISVVSTSNVNLCLEDEYQLFDRLHSDNLYFPNLVKFCLCDPKDIWISSGDFFTMLDMCPSLEKLRLEGCDGFSNKIASQLASILANKKLKYLIIDYCDLLGPSGVEDLLKIHSLVELQADLCVTEVTKQQFDEHPLQQMAEERGVSLQLTIHVSYHQWVD